MIINDTGLVRHLKVRVNAAVKLVKITFIYSVEFV
jgi:hypothetical protein